MILLHAIHMHGVFSRLMFSRCAEQLSQIRLLIDAFDKNGDGVVSLAEFLEFVGQEERGSHKADALQQKCVYNTTCAKVCIICG